MKPLKISIVVALVLGAILWCATNKKEVATQKSNTTLMITNQSKDSVLVYLTLGSQDSTFVQDVSGIFGITQSGLVGSFYLQPNDTLSYTSIKKLSGNIGFGTQGINCPDSTWKDGVNIFEFNLNEPQESIDISSMGGINCIVSADMNSDGWEATPVYPNVKHIQNDTLYNNRNRVGVYPYGCTDCTDTIGKANCLSEAETPNSSPICNPTRAKGIRGGVVLVTFKGYTK